jgi:hypothetical protein
MQIQLLPILPQSSRFAAVQQKIHSRHSLPSLPGVLLYRGALPSIDIEVSE